MTPSRWEHGSFLPFTLPSEWVSNRWWASEAVLLGSGRQALRQVVKRGILEGGWTRLHLPSYVCPSVLEAVRPLIAVTGYTHIPLTPPEFPTLSENDAILVSAHFGIEPLGLSQLPTEKVILDLTHDPIASWVSPQDYAFAFASLRKTLPVPDGGLAWTGVAPQLPKVDGPGAAQVAAAKNMVLAMFLKQEYLNGAEVDKSQYLDLARRFEEQMADLPGTAGTNFTSELLPLLPVDEWRTTRLRNAELLASLLDAPSVLSAHPTPFGVVVRLRTREHRDTVRSRLVAGSVYPAVLWDLDRELATDQDRTWSSRMLHLHTDYRYGHRDLERVAREVLRAAEGAGR